MAGNDINQKKSLSDTAKDTADKAYSAAKDAGDQASAKAADLQDQASGVADQLKDRAAQHVGEARDLVSNIASEARSKVAEIVDQQKNRGADQLSGFSKAAQSAAGELEGQSPQVARLMRDAAGTVDSLAGDLRSSDLSDVVASVSSFARKQPVAFFAASVLAGFVLARFVKSEPVAVEPFPTSRRSGR